MRALLYTLLISLCLALPLQAGTSIYGTWTLEDSPKIISDDSFVPEGSTLTVEAGVIVEIHEGLNIQIYGQLNCYGTSDNPVIFRAFNRDEIWEGINIIGSDEGLTSTLHYTQILDARIGLSAYEGVFILDSCFIKSSYHSLLLENHALGQVQNSQFAVTSHISEAKTVFVINSILDLSGCSVVLDIPSFTGPPAGGALHYVLSEGIIDSCHVGAYSTSGADGIRLQNCQSDVSISRTSIHVTRVGRLTDRSSAAIYASQSFPSSLDRISIHTETDGGPLYGIHVTSGSSISLVNSIVAATNISENADRYAAFIDPNSGNSSIDFGYTTVHDMHVVNDETHFSTDGGPVFTFDPRWTYPDQEDYRLRDGSPCIDAGSPDTPRDPDGSLPDLGAIVYVLEVSVEPVIQPVSQFSLSPVWPNPFNASTQFTVQLAVPAHLHIRIQNILGRTVSELADRRYNAGSHQFTWQTAASSNLASGVYLLQVVVGNQAHTQRLVLLK
jgi:Secretion system C-terminal sorting domain